MSQRAIVALGPGTVGKGFPAVTARLEHPGNGWMQVNGSLPPAPDIPALYRNWRLLYEALYQGRRRSGIEIESTSITHFSASEFSQIQQRLEQRLNQWLSAESFQPIETQLRTQLDPTGVICLAIETDDGDAWRLPWHCWDLVRLAYRRAEIIFSTSTYSPLPAARCRPSNPNPATVKLLAILGNCTGIDVEQDRQLLQHLPGVALTLLDEPQRRVLTEQLWASGWDILFFAGHSTSQPDATGGRLYINQHPQHNSLTMGELQEALHQAVQQGLQLAIFNSCDGLGLVRDLAAASVPLPVTIAMREPVPDVVAQEFLKYFLRAFAYGEPFYWAVRQAREQLKGIEDEYPGASWLPVVCQHPAAVPPVWPELTGDIAVPQSTPSRRPRPLRRFFRRPVGIAVVVLGAAIATYPFWGVWAARQLNAQAIQQYEQGKLLVAKRYFQFATMLNPLAPEPHYNLGWFCDEILHDLDCARQSFWRAAQRGHPAAYAEAARSEILQGNLVVALKAIKACLELTPSPGVTASCLKNRAWVRLQTHERIDEAERDLRSAIQLERDSPHAHCLLAQVLEAQGRAEEARASWSDSQMYARDQYEVPELDECLGWIHQRLRSQGDLP